MENKDTEFEKIVREHKRRIYTVCYMFSQDQSEIDDLFQDILINIWRGLDSFTGDSFLGTWIWKVSLNTCINHSKRAQKELKKIPLDVNINLYEDVDAESMSKGKDAVKMLLKSIEAKVKEGTASNVEKDRQTIMMIVHEAMARGVEFLPIDIYKSTAHSYVPEDGKIRMPFAALPGVGEAAAEQLANARNDGGPEFSSIEDFEDRARAGKSTIEILRKCGAFGDLPESDQMSLF